MDFVTGALPNVMFLVGMIAIGLGLGVQFKMIAVEGQLSKGARVGASGVGTALLIASVALYLRPASGSVTAAPQMLAGVGEPTPATVAGLPTTAAAVVPAQAATLAPASAPIATAAPQVRVPDLAGRRVEDARAQVVAAGLRLGEAEASCAALGVNTPAKGKKNTIMCQWPVAGSEVSGGTIITYVISGGKD